jgi:membrane complex biogenesis BtpA family protein
MLTDQGIIEGDAHHTLRTRQHLAPHVRIFADVHVKHAVPLAPLSIEQAARDNLERGGADALIISSHATGQPTELADVQRVRRACPAAKILLGSGVTAENIAPFLPWIDGVIVGTSVKRDGQIANPVDPRRVAALTRRLAQ